MVVLFIIATLSNVIKTKTRVIRNKVKKSLINQ